MIRAHDFTAVGNSLVELSLTSRKIVRAELIEDFKVFVSLYVSCVVKEVGICFYPHHGLAAGLQAGPEWGGVGIPCNALAQSGHRPRTERCLVSTLLLTTAA
ncbi:unnamed protein product [Sphagnum balticum]